MLAKLFALRSSKQYKRLFNQKSIPTFLGLMLVGTLLYVDLTDNRAINLLLNRLEWLVYDYRMQLTHYSVAPPQVFSENDIVLGSTFHSEADSNWDGIYTHLSK